MLHADTNGVLALASLAFLLPALAYRSFRALPGSALSAPAASEKSEVASGLAIYTTLAVLLWTIGAAVGDTELSLLWLQGLLFVACLLGTMEQLFRLPTQWALPIRLLVVLVAYLGGFGFQVESHAGAPYGAVVDLPLTLLFYLGMMGSLSLLDRLAGLATGVTLILAFTLLGLVLNWPGATAPLLLLAIACCCSGHLLLNQWGERQRLGIAAQLQLASLICAVTISSRSWGFTLGLVFIPLIAVVIPMTDRFFGVLLRLRMGEERAPAEHMQSLFLNAGFSERWVVFAVWIAMLQVGVLINIVYTTESLAIAAAGGTSLLVFYAFVVVLLARLSDRFERQRDPKKLRILFLSHYYHPEVNAPASRLYEHAREWAAAGHEVTVLTAVPSAPHGWPYPGYRNMPWQEELIGGVRVIRVWTFMAANRRRIRRSMNYLSFMASSLFALLFIRRHDVLIATTPQFFCGLAGAVASLFRKERFILEIRDIWPESIVAVDASRTGMAYDILIRLARFMYRRAERIVTVGDGYRDKLLTDHAIDPAKIAVVPNGVDFELFNFEGEERTGDPEQFIVSYVGTVGMAHGLDVVLGAALLLRDREDIRFVIAGDGSERGRLERAATEAHLSNVEFRGLLAKRDIPALLNASGACLVHLRDKPLFATVLPSKMFEAMAMGRPVILGVRGGSAEIVARYNAGICIEPENAEQLARAVERLAGNREMAYFMGVNGHEYVQHYHSRTALARDYLEIMRTVPEKRFAPIESTCAESAPTITGKKVP